MEPEIEARFERIESLFGGFEKRFESRLGETDRRIESRLGEFEKRLSGQMRAMQTEILKAFLPWQEQIRIQFRELEANTGNSVTATKQRMDVMERRLGEIEKRLLMNPPAA